MFGPPACLDPIERLQPTGHSICGALGKVKLVTRREEVELPPAIEHTLVIINGHIRFTYHFEPITTHDNRGILIDTNPEEFRLGLDNVDKVELTVSVKQVLVYSRVAQETKPFLVITHHNRVGACVPTRQI